MPICVSDLTVAVAIQSGQFLFNFNIVQDVPVRCNAVHAAVVFRCGKVDGDVVFGIFFCCRQLDGSGIDPDHIIGFPIGQPADAFFTVTAINNFVPGFQEAGNTRHTEVDFVVFVVNIFG